MGDERELLQRYVSERLAQTRIGAGLSKRDVAQAVGCTPNSVYNWEHGRGLPTLPQLADWARACGTTLDALLPHDADGLRERMGEEGVVRVPVEATYDVSASLGADGLWHASVPQLPGVAPAPSETAEGALAAASEAVEAYVASLDDPASLPEYVPSASKTTVSFRLTVPRPCSEFVTIPEAARRLGYASPSMYAVVRRGDIREYVVGGARMVRLADVDAYGATPRRGRRPSRP